MTQQEQLTNFFNAELEALELKTGSNQFARIMALPEGEKELVRLVEILVTTCMQPPFDQMSAEIKMRVIQDQMIKDNSFAAPPFGQLSGFNQRIVWKWLNAHWQMYSRAFELQIVEEKITYAQYLKKCERLEIPPMTEVEFNTPLTEERKQEYLEQIKRNLSGIQDPEKTPRSEFRKRYGESALPGYYASKQKFVINGIEIYAESEEEAQAMYKSTIEA